MEYSGWRDSLEEIAQEEIRSSAKDLTLEELITTLVQKSPSIPPPIQQELKGLVQESIQRILLK